MNNAPPSIESLTHATEVLELASLLDHRVPTPDKARILAWARQIDRHSTIERDDLLDAVQAYYDKPSAQPVSVGDVIEAARRSKRDRLHREADAERDRRRTQVDAKAAADEVLTLTAAFATGPTPRTPRLEAAEVALQCVTDRTSAMAALREFSEAKAEARKPKKAAS